MEIGASLWATANQTSESGAAITKTRHIGCRWGYSSLVFQPESPLFPLAKATGLTVERLAEHDLRQPERPAVLERGRRLLSLLCRRHGLQWRYREAQRRRPDLGDLRCRCGGAREMGSEAPPCRSRRLLLQRRYASPNWRRKINNPYQKKPMSGAVLQETVNRYNGFVAAGDRFRLQEADPDVQDREAAVLCGLVDADPARHAHRAALQHQRRGDRHPRPGDPGPLLLRANRKADLPSTGWPAAWSSAGSPAATPPRERPETSSLISQTIRRREHDERRANAFHQDRAG